MKKIAAIEFVKSKKFSFKISFDGILQRFDRGGKTLSGWAVGKVYNCAGNPVECLMFGDFATDEKYEWWSRTATTPEEQAEMNALVQNERKEHLRLKLERQKETKKIVQEFWETLSVDTELTPYLLKKGLLESYGARTDDEENLYVPLYDANGGLWNLQRISPDGSKKFHPGGRILGCFYSFPHEPKTVSSIFICEGFATGASIFEAFQLQQNLPGFSGSGMVACAFNAGNLKATSLEIRKRYPSATIRICGDDDVFTHRPDNTPYNPGREKAMDAARACGGDCVFPRFTGLPNFSSLRPTDFNDLACLKDLKIVFDQVTGSGETPKVAGDTATKKAPVVIPTIKREPLPPRPDGLTPLEPRFDQKGRQIPPTEKEVSDHLVAFYAGRLVKQERDLFVYVGTHWKHLDSIDADQIKTQIQFLYSGEAQFHTLESTFRMFMLYVPRAGRDMFRPLEWCVNFRNGTLWAENKGPGKYNLTFKPHDPGDFAINLLPFDYKENWDEKNEVFEQTLERVFEDAPDKEGRIRAVRQMFGACLMPAFPHLFMLHGPKGTGKSTIIKLAMRMVDDSNRCSVEPKDFNGFNMESMAGKLVNFDPDIDTNAPLTDNIVKKIYDRMDTRISRKNKTDLSMPLPPTHVFGGNEIPRTLDAVSRSHDRRWTFIAFTKGLTEQANYDKRYAEWCFDQGPQGILNSALMGLKDLLDSNGHFFVPESGREEMEKWQLRTDPVGLFLIELKEGEILDNSTKVMLYEDAKIERKKLWNIFQEWHEDTFNFKPRIGKIRFFELLERKGMKLVTVRGTRYFSGLSVQTGAGSIC